MHMNLQSAERLIKILIDALGLYKNITGEANIYYCHDQTSWFWVQTSEMP